MGHARRAGLLVDHTPPAVPIGQVAVVSILLLGQLPIGAPVRVVAVVDQVIWSWPDK